jgi:hypothetical protein
MVYQRALGAALLVLCVCAACGDQGSTSTATSGEPRRRGGAGGAEDGGAGSGPFSTSSGGYSCDDEGFPCENDLDCCGDRVCRLNERGMEPLCTDP